MTEILSPVYGALIRNAQGDVVYNDDTVMKVLELMKETNPTNRKRHVYIWYYVHC